MLVLSPCSPLKRSKIQEKKCCGKLGSPKTEITGGCEPPNVGTEDNEGTKPVSSTEE